MRQERDALGDWSIDEGAFYGIATARLLSAVNVPGPAFPPELPGNLLRVRQAQAVAFGRSRQWPGRTAFALEQAAARLAAVPERLAEQIVVTPWHGGGARSLVLNVDEVLANAALLELGGDRGDYHLVAPLFQLDRGLQPLSAYMTAFHITMLTDLSQLLTATELLSAQLERLTQTFSGQETVAQLQYQDVELSTLGGDFSRCGDSIGRARLRLEQGRSALIPCWQGPPEVLPVLRELTGLELAVRGPGTISPAIPICMRICRRS
jgi:aspartate ammonia-lyase